MISRGGGLADGGPLVKNAAHMGAHPLIYFSLIVLFKLQN